MTSLAYTVPVAGTDLNSVADPQISTALTTIKSWANNGNIDLTNLSAIARAVLGSTPIGSMSHYAGSSDPIDPDGQTRWLVCDGRAISRSTYTSLFGVVSTTYGAGDGSTTFNIPDLRGRAAIGADPTGTHLPASHPALGSAGGEENHTLTAAEVATHAHPLTSTGAWVPTSASSSWGPRLFTAGTDGPGAQNTGGISSAQNTGNNAGGGGSHNNLQPYLAVNHIIRVL